MIFRYLRLTLLLSLPIIAAAQPDSIRFKLSFTGDFRFRIEQDWDSRKSDGSYRDDRTRLRYRLRFGFNYQYNQWASFGMRLRTGSAKHQQDPQVTLGTGSEEFGTLSVSFEKLFFQAKHNWFSGWVGKNTFPFEKQNELFWSDNVFPEGVFISGKLSGKSNALQSLQLNLGHFIVSSAGNSLNADRYFQGIQLLSTHWNNRLKVFPSFYYFHKMPDIPDGKGTYDINYSIFHLGAKIKVLERPAISIGVDYYNNFEDLNQKDSIPQDLRDQNQGIVMGLSLGSFQNKGDWTIQTYYTYLERFAAVDFLAQNDWMRWDYSSQDSPAGRLTNYHGVELLAGYVVNKQFKVNMRYFIVGQKIPYGTTKETNNRVRLDLDIGF
ncbi:MAG: putative porin [Bacteroidetes bacterium]|nr:putative porin [Bacteroidota bacterium]MDA1122588.1 putative porin [Bacteroidota bacterium]